MADLPTQLKNYLESPQTRTLASFAPLGIVAGAAGLIIGAAVATPAFAAAGLGLVLTSVAANIASSLVYDVIKPDLDEGRRARLIAKGLKEHDPGVIRLVAEALANAGPNVARAIPDSTRAALRAELIDALKLGMLESGGALAEIAPRYVGALSDPRTNWAALQSDLWQTISTVSQTMDASAGGVISESHQEAPHTGGPISQSISAHGPNSRVEKSSQIIVGGASREAHAPAGPSAGHVPSAPERMRELLARHTQRLHQLEQHAAIKGIDTPPHVATEIAEIRAEIMRIEKHLEP